MTARARRWVPRRAADSGAEWDLIGVGLGPANLSLAALADPVPGLRALFLERRPHFAWHAGLMLPGAQLQVSFLKDLVTLVDPTSEHSFLNFLAEHGRLYRFLVRGDAPVSRREFAEYYAWVAARVRCARFGTPVERVEHVDGRGFAVHRPGEPAAVARTLVLGTGRTPSLPPCAAPHVGPSVLHSSALLHEAPRIGGRRVLVVGGGQSGAEVVAHLLDDTQALPSALTWASSRGNFLPLDDSPFVNEWFHPGYVEHFHALASHRRRRLLAEQRLASDGISAGLLERIYRRLYELDFVERAPLAHRLLPAHELVDLHAQADGLVATFRDADRGEPRHVAADVVVLATGYRYELPACLDGLGDRLAAGSHGFELRRDYSVAWDGPEEDRIFVQNAGQASHGIADPNLSLVAWRSATILNSVCGAEVYATGGAGSTLAWDDRAADEAPRRQIAVVGR